MKAIQAQVKSKMAGISSNSNEESKGSYATAKHIQGEKSQKMAGSKYITAKTAKIELSGMTKGSSTGARSGKSSSKDVRYKNADFSQKVKASNGMDLSNNNS